MSKTKKILLLSKLNKCKNLIKHKIIKKNEFLDIDKLPNKISNLKGIIYHPLFNEITSQRKRKN